MLYQILIIYMTTMEFKNTNLTLKLEKNSVKIFQSLLVIYWFKIPRSKTVR